MKTIKEQLAAEKKQQFDGPWETQGYHNGIEAAELICHELIEKGTPKAPIVDFSYSETLRQALIKVGKEKAAEHKSYYCPNCNNQLLPLKLASIIEYRPKHCSERGQEFNWSEVQTNESE